MKLGSWVIMDASAYVRATQGNAEAVEYLRAQAYGAVRFVAPPHFLMEVANALRSSVISRQSTANKARAGLRAVLGVKLEVDSDSELSAEALDFALEHGITAYDAAYAVLALRRGASLVTADTGLAQAAGNAGVPTTLLTEN